MKKISGVLIALAVLSGCATFDQMKEGLIALMDTDSSVAVSILGAPSEKKQSGSETVYVWSVRWSKTYDVYTSSYSGNVKTTYKEVRTDYYHCLIELAADKNNKLIRWEYNGNIGGCKNYIQSLKGYPDAKPYYDRGLAMAAYGDTDFAISHFSEAIRLSPQFAAAYKSRGDAWKWKGDNKKAINDYDKAVQINPPGRGGGGEYSSALLGYMKEDHDKGIAH